MKYIFLALLSLSLLSCATKRDRDPAAIEEATNVRNGLTTDFFGSR